MTTTHEPDILEIEWVAPDARIGIANLLYWICSDRIGGERSEYGATDERLKLAAVSKTMVVSCLVRTWWRPVLFPRRSS
jgi:hypothetical protein